MTIFNTAVLKVGNQTVTATYLAGVNLINTGMSLAVDLFIIAGQSNALGVGTAAESPLSPDGLWINGSNLPIPLSDPLGNVNTGSAWPAFSNEWKSLTGRRSAFVYTAAVGASIVAPGTGWNSTGGLRSQAVAAYNNAIVSLANASLELGNVYILWLQGEAEAQTYNGTTITEETYRIATEDLGDYFKAQIPIMQTMGLIHISGPTSNLGVAASEMSELHRRTQKIRAAQTLACENNINLTSIYNGSYHFVGRGLSKDGTHYNQTGYNLIGKMAARGLNGSLGGLSVVSSPLISTANYPRPTHGFGASASFLHTTPAGTKLIAVAVSHGWEGAAVQAKPTLTFNGVAMRHAVFSGGYSSAAPIGTSYASIFYIDETLYGASLAGVTANFVISTTNNQMNTSLCVFNCKDVILADSESGNYQTSIAPGVDSISANLTTFADNTLVIAVASGGQTTSATALTSTMTGVTKVMDNSLNNGSIGLSMAAGYSENVDRVIAQTISNQFSGNVNHSSLAVCAFRGKYQDEYP